MTVLASMNTPQAMQSGLAEGRIPRFSPMLMLWNDVVIHVVWGLL